VTTYYESGHGISLSDCVCFLPKSWLYTKITANFETLWKIVRPLPCHNNTTSGIPAESASFSIGNSNWINFENPVLADFQIKNVTWSIILHSKLAILTIVLDILSRFQHSTVWPCVSARNKLSFLNLSQPVLLIEVVHWSWTKLSIRQFRSSNKITLWEAVQRQITDGEGIAEWSNSQNTQVIVSTWVEGYVDI